ncbi:hypothetical protein EB796_020177 [Bugula neritina]|uniref:SCNN1B n=1 Tax=Bugula neritina TaxID=10212 RepID=A0A7J7J802_BUGNE|nr:hypothetical protein EB796_020177 [Bugula neritina]
MLLHNQGETPDIFDAGFNLSPGFRNSIALTYMLIERLKGADYSNCTDTTSMKSSNDYHPGLYTRQGCFKTCVQQKTIEKCGCANAMYRVPANVQTCDLLNYHCVEDVATSLSFETECTCPLACQESQYISSVTSSQWPARNYEPYWKQSMQSRGGALKKLLNKDSTIKLSEEFLKVDIYFNTLNYQHYKEKASMTFEDLVGSIGGHLGLWIGMSIISFVEVFELIVALVAVCTKNVYQRKKRKHNFATEAHKMT